MDVNRAYPCNPENYHGGRALPVSFLVIHYVGALGGAKNNAQYYGRTPGVGASAHYFVGHASEGAAVYQSVADGDTAWHCGRSDGKYVHPTCRNANSIGIEMCCHQDARDGWYFDPATVDRTVELARTLMDKYHIDAAHVVRHFDVTGKICPAPFVNDLTAWVEFKKRLVESDMTEAQVREIVEKALAERDTQVAHAAQIVSTWEKKDWDELTAAGVFDGTRPGAPLTRGQAAVVIGRLKKLWGIA